MIIVLALLLGLFLGSLITFAGLLFFAIVVADGDEATHTRTDFTSPSVYNSPSNSISASENVPTYH
jgi:hypothetical protein